MGKISQVSSKYIIHSGIEIEGVVDKPDVIGAVFGQTEGLIGSELELRELQRSGRVGRIEVNVDVKGGKTRGTIIVPSSMDKAETSIIAASLEVIQRIGPCNAKIRVKKIEDVRISKRKYVLERAKELLKTMVEGVMPDSQEIADEVAKSVRVQEVQEYGRDRLPAGPAINESDEIIVVEGRADVLTLLRHGFKNAIAMNGTSVPQTVIDLSKKKEITVFVDGDRGGRLIIKELLNVAEIDFVTMAPDGKEVEEITKKEIHKALRSKVAAEQMKMEIAGKASSESERINNMSRRVQSKSSDSRGSYQKQRNTGSKPRHSSSQRGSGRSGPPNKSGPRHTRKVNISPKEKSKFKELLEDLIGTRGAYILDNNLNILGKVPLTELSTTVRSLKSGIYAVVFDGMIEKQTAFMAERAGIKYVVGMDSKVNPGETRTNAVVFADLL